MKHLLHKLNSLRLLTLLTLLLGVGGSQVWADTSTLTFTQACNGSGTADDGVTWTVASDGTESTFDKTKGIHYGTGKAKVEYITLSTSGISGTIAKVVANASTASGGSATVSVTVGGSAFGGDAQSLTSSAANYTFTGSATGEIVVTVTKPSSATGALYVKSITVTYETVTDARTAVNLSDFTATNTTLIAGGSPSSTSTSATNDQPGWTAAYSYSSSNTDVATVDEDGVITAVAKGMATITCSLNVDAEDEVYKAGTTSSKTIDITVTNPFHTVTFSSNGSTYSSSSVEEGESITLPAENPKEVNGYTFVGWIDGTITGTTDDEPEYISSSVKMGNADVTYYAVFAEAEVSYSESQIEKTQTLEYDTWTYVGETTDKTDYRLFHSDSYIQSAEFDLSLLKKVIVHGGTFGGASYNSLTIGDGSNVWKEVTVSGSKETGTNTYTGGTALSGTKALRITCNSGSASESGVRISKVEIYTKKKTTTYAHYCTTVSALPRPIITMKDVEMTWGDTDKSVAPSATVNDGDYDGDFTFTVDKAGLTVGADGKLTSNTPGTYVVTANIAATAEHQAASTTCTVTVGKQNVTLAYADEIVRKKTSDASYTQTATATPDTYDGTITYSKESASTSTGATVNTTTGAVDFSATGSVIVKATASATDLYNSAETTYTILIQTDPKIDIENTSIPCGETYTIDDSKIEGGDITVTSSNPAVASVAGLVITSHAVGTTTITVATAESDTYVAGEETFTLTVTAPTGESKKPSAEPEAVFYESFDKCDDGDGGNDGKWSGISSFGAFTTDISTWTHENGGGASKCTRFGTSSKKGTVTTPSLSLEAEIEYTLTFKAGAWNGSNENTTLNLSATNATLDKSSVTMTKGAWSTYTVTITNASSEATITFAGEKASNSRFFLDEVKVTKPGTPLTSTSVTTTGGLATYCYQYPLNLDGISGAKAYVVKEVDMEKGKVMLTQITGTIKGGVPFILKSDGDDATFEIPLADESTTVPAGNLLVGTLAPTFVAQTSGDYTNFAYSKSNECFVKLGEAGNTVPANRAYLPVKLSGNNSAKSFALTFDNADGIARTQIEGGEERVYNLAGQRLQKAQRGVNIINGRKVLVK